MPIDATVASLVGPRPGIDDSRQLEGATPERVAEIAREFEGLLLHQLLRQLRTASPWADEESGALFGSQLFEAIDVELARHLAVGGGLGLAEVLVPRMVDQAVTDDVPTLASVIAAGPEYSSAPVSPAAGPAGPGFFRGVTSAFGWRQDPIDGGQRFHAGVDLKAAYGREVGAALAGRVVSAGEQGGYGLTVVLEHRPGVQTRYAHLSSIAVEPGDRVGAGQPIGRAGQSGRATGTHLHFELIHEGQPVDPARIEGGLEELLKTLRLSADWSISRT